MQKNQDEKRKQIWIAPCERLRKLTEELFWRGGLYCVKANDQGSQTSIEQCVNDTQTRQVRTSDRDAMLPVKSVRISQTNQFSLLGVDGITELQKCLKLVVLGEGNDLHDRPKLAEYLKKIWENNISNLVFSNRVVKNL